MATRLKDFVSYYDVLEIPAECTKVRVRIIKIPLIKTKQFSSD